MDEMDWLVVKGPYGKSGPQLTRLLVVAMALQFPLLAADFVPLQWVAQQPPHQLVCP